MRNQDSHPLWKHPIYRPPRRLKAFAFLAAEQIHLVEALPDVAGERRAEALRLAIRGVELAGREAFEAAFRKVAHFRFGLKMAPVTNLLVALDSALTEAEAAKV